jgi:hypothetical protein
MVSVLSSNFDRDFIYIFMTPPIYFHVYTPPIYFHVYTFLFSFYLAAFELNGKRD